MPLHTPCLCDIYVYAFREEWIGELNNSNHTDRYGIHVVLSLSRYRNRSLQHKLQNKSEYNSYN